MKFGSATAGNGREATLVTNIRFTLRAFLRLKRDTCSDFTLKDKELSIPEKVDNK